MNATTLETAKPTKVNLASLVTSDTMQPRHRTDRDAIQRYRQVFKNNAKPPFPPIIVARITDDPTTGGQLLVVDGFHRVAAAREAEVKTITAKVIEATRAEAEWIAVQMNREHGVPLAKRDHVEAFQRYIRAGANVAADGSLKSYREITAELGGIRTHQTFARWMAKMFPAVAAAMGGREVEEQIEPEQGDSATFAETRYSDYIQGARRLAIEMPRAQRRAVETSPRSAARTAAEKEQRAAELTRETLLGGLGYLLEAVGRVLEMTPQEVAAAVEARREDDHNADF